MGKSIWVYINFYDYEVTVLPMENRFCWHSFILPASDMMMECPNSGEASVNQMI